MDRAQAHHAAALHGDGGKVYGVADIAVFQIVLQFLHRHTGAVQFALRCGRAQMRHGDHMRRGQQAVCREVRHIGGHLPHIQRRQHGLVVDNLSPRQIDKAHAGFHLFQRGGVNHVPRLFRIVDVDGDIVTAAVQIP